MIPSSILGPTKSMTRHDMSRSTEALYVEGHATNFALLHRRRRHVLFAGGSWPRFRKSMRADRRCGAPHTLWQLSPTHEVPQYPPPSCIYAPLCAPRVGFCPDTNISQHSRVNVDGVIQKNFHVERPEEVGCDAWSERRSPNQASGRAETLGTKRESPEVHFRPRGGGGVSWPNRKLRGVTDKVCPKQLTNGNKV